MDATFFPQSLKQEQLLTKFADIIEKKGKLSQKTRGVFASVAEGGELVISKTKDGEETRNVATKGDYIITYDTSSLERYIISAEKFNNRYVHQKEKYYVPNDKARIFALQITPDSIYQNNLEGLDKLINQPDHPVYIEPPWSENQTLRLNDYLVCPVAKNEVYRIAQIEFKETYKEL